MTTEMNPPDENPNETPNVKQMRETLERQSDELVELREFRRDTLMKEAGLDPNQGVGKALAKDIERGDYAGDWTTEALQTYAAEEYGWAEEADTGDEEATSENEAKRSLVTEGQKQLDEVQAAGSPPNVEDPASRAAAAEADGDWMAQIREGTTVTVEQMNI